MTAANASRRYNAGAITLHWIIAVLILTNIGIAWYFNSLPGPAKSAPVALHKSIGITVLVLSLIRLGWRLAFPPPKPPASFGGWERILANTVHVLFYVIMIGLPLTGWIFSSAATPDKLRPIVLYNTIPWPTITPLTTLPPGQIKAVHGAFTAAHGLLAKLAYVLIVLHVAGALKHLFICRDGMPGRMIPFLRPPP